MKSKEYREGFEAGRENAEGFHHGKLNARERQLRTLSPYSKLTDPGKDADWRRGRLDGDEDYWGNKQGITPCGISI